MNNYMKIIKARYEVDLDSVKKNAKKSPDKQTEKIQLKLADAEKLLGVAVRANNAGLTAQDIQLLAKNC